ncbi:MAG: DsbA family protein [Alphaproteobacteria bacterium]|nr:DsbA family protein [Alphaproteobacteria bacterium]
MPAWTNVMSRSIGALALVVLLAWGPSTFAQSRDGLSVKQQQEVESLIRDYLKKNPGFVLELLNDAQRFQEDQETTGARAKLIGHSDSLYKDKNAPVGGNPKGDVTIVEFFDYKCPYCKRAVAPLTEFLAKDSKVRLVFKEFPILGPESVVAARAALAARKQGKYSDLHLALMDLKGALTEASVFATAETIGLDVKRLRDDMRSKEIDEMLAANRKLAQALGIKGTPGFVIGDNIVGGMMDQNALRQAVADARVKCATC